MSRNYDDGIINSDFYWNSRYKIVWILKETNNKGNGKCNLRDYLGYLDFHHGNNTVAKRIALASYCIMNNYSDASGYFDCDELKDELQHIAWINIGKDGGSASTSVSRLKYLYNENKDIIFDQIVDAEPDILIFGHTMWVMFDDFDCSFLKLSFEFETSCQCYIEVGAGNSPLYIEARHPGIRGITNKSYVSDIVRCVRAWEKGNYKFANNSKPSRTSVNRTRTF